MEPQSHNKPLGPDDTDLLTSRTRQEPGFRWATAAIIGTWVFFAVCIIGGSTTAGCQTTCSAHGRGSVVFQLAAITLVSVLCWWTLRRSETTVEAEGIRMVRGWRTRMLRWEDIEGFSGPHPPNKTGLWVKAVGRSPVSVLSPFHTMSRLAANAAAERLNRALRAEHGREDRQAPSGTFADRSSPPAGLARWQARAERGQLPVPGSDAARAVTGNAWEAPSAQLCAISSALIGCAFAAGLLSDAAFDLHDTSRMAQVVSAPFVLAATAAVVWMIIRQRTSLVDHGIQRVNAVRTRHIEWSEIKGFCTMSNGGYGAVLEPDLSELRLPTAFHSGGESAMATLAQYLGESAILGAPTSSAKQQWAHHASVRRAQGPPEDPAIRSLLVGQSWGSRLFLLLTIPYAALSILGAAALALAAAFVHTDTARVAQIAWSVILVVQVPIVLWLHGRSGTRVNELGVDRVSGWEHDRVPWFEVTGFTSRHKGRCGIFVQRGDRQPIRVSTRMSLDDAQTAVGLLARAVGLPAEERVTLIDVRRHRARIERPVSRTS